MTTITTNARESASVTISAEELAELRRRAAEFDRIQRESADRVEREADNRERCKRFAEELDAYVNGLGYYDPDAGEYCLAEDPDEIPEDAEPACYFDVNDVYGVRYIVDEYGERTAVRYMVACGGPNVYLDTESGCVELYWGADVARYPMSREAIDWLNEEAEVFWPMKR